MRLRKRGLQRDLKHFAHATSTSMFDSRLSSPTMGVPSLLAYMQHHKSGQTLCFCKNNDHACASLLVTNQQAYAIPGMREYKDSEATSGEPKVVARDGGLCLQGCSPVADLFAAY